MIGAAFAASIAKKPINDPAFKAGSLSFQDRRSRFGGDEGSYPLMHENEPHRTPPIDFDPPDARRRDFDRPGIQFGFAAESRLDLSRGHESLARLLRRLHGANPKRRSARRRGNPIRQRLRHHPGLCALPFDADHRQVAHRIGLDAHAGPGSRVSPRYLGIPRPTPTSRTTKRFRRRRSAVFQSYFELKAASVPIAARPIISSRRPKRPGITPAARPIGERDLPAINRSSPSSI